jgi:predicted nucleotidyltransferase
LALLDPDLRDILSALNAHEVKYLLVGGYAVGVYSEPRATKDLDIFIQSHPENGEAVFRALAEYGAPPEGMTPADFSNKPDSVFQIGVPPVRIDILQSISGVTFDEAWENRITAFIDEIPTNVISRDDLIRNKLAAGRRRDLLDVEDIREAAE